MVILISSILIHYKEGNSFSRCAKVLELLIIIPIKSKLNISIIIPFKSKLLISIIWMQNLPNQMYNMLSLIGNILFLEIADKKISLVSRKNSQINSNASDVYVESIKLVVVVLAKKLNVHFVHTYKWSYKEDANFFFNPISSLSFLSRAHFRSICTQ